MNLPIRFARHALRTGAASLALATVACSPSEPRLALPYPIDSFCGWRVPRGTAINSIVSATNDQITGLAPSLPVLQARARKDGGAIGHWPKTQLLKLPNVAHGLGAPGNYVRMRTAAVIGVPPDGSMRPVYIEIEDGARWRWIRLIAYDSQDVCSEGARSL